MTFTHGLMFGAVLGYLVGYIGQLRATRQLRDLLRPFVTVAQAAPENVPPLAIDAWDNLRTIKL